MIEHYKVRTQVVAVSRSGHHAVNNWILKKFRPWDHYYFNVGLIHKVEFDWSAAHIWYYGEGQDPQLLQGAITNYPKAGPYDGAKSCHVLATSHENITVEAAEKLIPEVTHRIVVVRDLRNWIASLFARNPKFSLSIDVWKDHVNVCVNKSHSIVPVFYDHWFTNPSYRSSLCVALGVPFNDDGLNDIKWTSHALDDGDKWHGQAQEKLTTLSRWRTVWDDPLYQGILHEDEEAYALNEEVFGHLYS